MSNSNKLRGHENIGESLYGNDESSVYGDIATEIYYIVVCNLHDGTFKGAFSKEATTKATKITRELMNQLYGV